MDFFLDFFKFFSKLLMLLLKVTKATTEHQKRPKCAKEHNKLFFLPAKKASAEIFWPNYFFVHLFLPK